MHSVGSINKLKVTIVVDNRSFKPSLIATWGLSMYIEADDTKILFDTNSSWNILKHNAEMLQIPLEELDIIFISHWHGDHTGGLKKLTSYLKSIGKKIEIYTPPGGRIKEVIRISNPKKIGNGLVSTGTMGTFTKEQSLIVNIREGPIVFVGCSHPGIKQILKRVASVMGIKQIYGLIGGYHIDAYEATKVIEDLKSFNVKIVGPCHCTTDDAMRILATKLKNNFIQIYAGKTLEFSSHT